ncbi:MAG TPA: diguanylate cyclase [Candidatus Saccharimonadales bacterium]|nr:diguanylate cyclase [Candidatus Saccharimonadales bacterium]
MPRMRIISLRDSLVLLVLLALGPAFALTFYTDAAQRRIAAGVMRRDAAHLVHLQVHETSRFVEGASRLLSGIAGVSQTLFDPDVSRPVLAGLLERDPRLSEMMLLRPSGRIAYRVPRGLGVGEAGVGAVFRRALGAPGLVVGDPQWDAGSRRFALRLGHRIPGPLGDPAGVVVASLDLVSFSESSAVGLLPEGAEMLILDRHGTVVAHQPDPQPWVGRRMMGSPLATEMLRSQEGTLEAVGSDGVARLYAFAPLHQLGWFAAIGVSEEAAFAEANQLLFRNLLVLVLAGLVASGAAWGIARALILRRLRALAGVADRLSAGDLSARADVRGLDEFAVVASAFNGMAERLLAMLRHEQGARDELAETVNRLVEQRTREVETLGKLGDMLQASQSVEEAYQVMGRMLGQLFPGTSGVICIQSGPYAILEATVAWGPYPEAGRTAVFKADDCWALRRGRPYLVPEGSEELRCAHLPDPAPSAYACFPMVAHGDQVGLLHLETPPGADGGARSLGEGRQRLAATVAEQLALSLANLRLRETLRRQSVRDPLTGLFNRRYMEETLERELRRAERAERPLSLILLDLDHFKDINDTFGHEAGDAALRAVAQMLMANLRAGDAACRFGGEEFVVILPEASLEDACRRAEMLCEAVRRVRPVHTERDLGTLAASLGVAAFPRHGVTAEAVMRAADAALYRAKAEGRGRVVVAD